MSTTTQSQAIYVLSADDLDRRLDQLLDAKFARWAKQQTPKKLTTEEAAKRCGRVNPDGSANVNAFKTFLARHPDLPREHAGRRLVFDEQALSDWLASRTRKRAA